MSTGAAAGVIGEMRRQQRREDARRARKRAGRQARWQGIRAMRDAGVNAGSELAASRWPFACASVCGNCGALALPAATTGGDPMRRDDAPIAPAACTACSTTDATLIDLSRRDMARALIDVEILDREIGAQHRTLGGPVAITVGLAALATASILFGAIPVVSVSLAAGSLLQGASAIQRWSTRGKKRRHARRWAHRARVEGPTTPLSSGTATGHMRSAPLSGRACIAYDVRVVWNGQSPMTPSAVALQEQAVDALHIGETDASRAYLALEPEQVPTEQVIASPAAVRYLATRGLEPTDGAFDYYETLILEQDVLVTKTDAAGRREIVSA